jgi:hypothetical protein
MASKRPLRRGVEYTGRYDGQSFFAAASVFFTGSLINLRHLRDVTNQARARRTLADAKHATIIKHVSELRQTWRSTFCSYSTNSKCHTSTAKVYTHTGFIHVVPESFHQWTGKGGKSDKVLSRIKHEASYYWLRIMAFLGQSEDRSEDENLFTTINNDINHDEVWLF